MENGENGAFLRVPELAKELGVSKSKAYTIIKNGFPHVVIGGSIRIPRVALTRLVAEAMGENAKAE